MLTPTEEGTPQGGVVSPLLMNVALHGMEQAAGVRYRKLSTDGAHTVDATPVAGEVRRRLRRHVLHP